MFKHSMKPLFLILSCLLILFTSHDGWSQQPGDINTIAGGGGETTIPTDTNLGLPRDVFVDQNDNVYIADTFRHRILKITPGGLISTVAGDGFSNSSGLGRFAGDDGAATEASLNFPSGVFVDSNGVIYIADTLNHRIRKVETDGMITTVAGDGFTDTDGIGRFTGDGGQAIEASLNSPHSVFVKNGIIYITDRDNHRIRKVELNGFINTIAGDGNVGFSGNNGPATSASLAFPTYVYVDDANNIYIADTSNQRVRKVDASGIITTVAGNGIQLFTGDGGPATSATMNFPSAVTLDASGQLYISDGSNNRIRIVDTNGIINTIIGVGVPGFAGDGNPAIDANINSPRGLFVKPDGTIYFADTNNFRIRKVDTSGVITTIAGNGTNVFAGDGRPATTGTMNFPASLTLGDNDEIYIADTFNMRIRKVDASGIITTIAGDGFIDNGEGRFRGDGGPATDASFNFPTSVALGPDGLIYVADTINHRIRTIDSSGIINTLAGDGIRDSFGLGRYSGDGGQATQASLNEPRGVFVDRNGLVYIADTQNHRIRTVDANGIINTVAGDGEIGVVGDGGPATQASLNFPSNIFVDGLGNIYIADTGNHRIRKVSPDGIMTTVVGDGFTGVGGGGRFAGDGGPATDASLFFPSDMTLDNAGNIYVVDNFSHRIRKVTIDGIINTVAGDGFSDANGGGQFSGDGGPALSASLNLPRNVEVDLNGNIYIADTANSRIRVVTGEGPVIPDVINIVNFTAMEDLGIIRLTWDTDVTPVQYGFNIYRSTQMNTGFQKLNDTPIFGTSTSFEYLDREKLTAEQVFYYELEVIDVGGNAERLAPVMAQVSAVVSTRLFQNAPNPFNPSTLIRYALPSAARVSLRIYNVLGQEVVTLLDDVNKPAGFDAVTWDGLNSQGERIASGVYLYQLTTSTGFNETRRMLLLR